MQFSPFELLTGVKMHSKDNLQIQALLESEYKQSVMTDKFTLREIAKRNILKHQESSRCQYNKKRKSSPVYNIGDLGAIQRTQFGTGLKLRPRFFGPYKIINVKGHDRYDVQKLGHHDGPNLTSSASDYMKPWVS